MIVLVIVLVVIGLRIQKHFAKSIADINDIDKVLGARLNFMMKPGLIISWQGQRKYLMDVISFHWGKSQRFSDNEKINSIITKYKSLFSKFQIVCVALILVFIIITEWLTRR